MTAEDRISKQDQQIAAPQERIEKLTEALVEERANCIMAYEWKNDLPELEETCDEDVARWKEEARQQLQKEGLLP